MKPDADGFLYPEIDPNKCVECGVCKRVCKYKTSDLNAVESTYAVTNRDEKQIMKAASGGLFSAAASAILSDGGCVFVATLTFDSGHPDTHHIMVENKEELWKLQGSKYVQSRIGRTYQQAKECLQNGRTVLFSGTPCQIAGLKSYLGKVYENLYTMDLICHGVPSAEFFDGYIQELNKKYRGKVTEYKFRDKTKGWGMNTAFEIVRGDKKTTIFKTAKVQSYLSLFYDYKIFRENCYSCPYAGSSRVGDMTIGDYWGIENEHPELDHTQFVEVLPNTGTSSRNRSILELTGLTDRIVRDLNDFSYIDQEIDFKEANEKIGTSRIESIRILEKMLEEQIEI